MSACLPGSRLPTRWSKPIALAPPRVAARSAVKASSAAASCATALASSAAVRVSPTMSRSLLDAQPSVPMARFTPARSSAHAGQKPEASLRFDSGQCTTLTPRSAHRWISASVSWVMCTAIRRSLNRPRRSIRAIGRCPCCSTDCCTSCAVSCRCRWTGMSSWSESKRTRSKLASLTVYGACGANAVATSGSSRHWSWTSPARSKYSSSEAAHAVGKSITGSPTRARNPCCR